MSLPIETLVLRRYRSVPSERIEFDNPTFLIGPNGAGKSNVVDAFSFLSEAMASPLHAVLDRRGGIQAVRNRTSGRSFPPNLGIGVTFGQLNGEVCGGRYSFELKALKNYGFEVAREQCVAHSLDGRNVWFDRKREEFDSNAGGLGPVLDPSLLALPMVAAHARFAPVLRLLTGIRSYAIDPRKLRELQDPDTGLVLRSDGSNAASVLAEIERRSPADMVRISELLASVVPNTTRVSTVKHGKNLTLDFLQEWRRGERSTQLTFEAFSMSDGTLRAVGLLAAVFQASKPRLTVVEEPEATIHAGALSTLLDVLRDAAEQTQLVVTTHSADILDSDWVRDNHLRVVTWSDGATRVATVADSAREAMRQRLMGAGELLRANALQASDVPDIGTAYQPALFEDVA